MGSRRALSPEEEAMKIEQATPGTRIKERDARARPKTVVSWENDGFGNTKVRVRNDHGRVSHIAAKNLGRYDRVEER
jgi:hypothetical protein